LTFFDKMILSSNRKCTVEAYILYIMYVTIFYIQIIFHFHKKETFYVGNTTDWKVWGDATYLEILFFMEVFPTEFWSILTFFDKMILSSNRKCTVEAYILHHVFTMKPCLGHYQNTRTFSCSYNSCFRLRRKYVLHGIQLVFLTTFLPLRRGSLIIQNQALTYTTYMYR
jgi:hypothetical protein